MQGTGPGKIWGAVPEFMWSYRREPRRSEDNVLRSRFEPGTSWIRSRNANAIVSFGGAVMSMGCLNGLTEVTVASVYGNKNGNRRRPCVIIPFSVCLSL